MAVGRAQRLDPARCPLFGAPNQCALTADPTAAECRYDTLTIPKELLALISEGEVRQTCVCQKCRLRFNASAGDADEPW
ncbi:MAG: hypothetical protein GTO14_05460 [Anaerolineales bacterium]|nr:hypothetical protein [Anaerolineales bacterium]